MNRHRESSDRDGNGIVWEGVRDRGAVDQVAFHIARAPAQPQALLRIVFEDFAELNTTLGADTANQIDQLIHRKIRSLIPLGDLLIQEESRKFLIVHAVSDPESPEHLAGKIVHSFSEPCSMGEQLFYVFFSVAISLYPQDGTDPLSLIQMADTTARELQKEGKNGIRFARQERDPGALTQKKRQLMADLPAAIDNGEIFFVYQGQYAHAQGRFVGAELLSRWQHPVFGAVPPTLFVPLAEQSGMIGSLTVRSLVAAAKAQDRLRAGGVEDFSLSVNISPAFLTTSQFYETIHFLVQEYDLSTKAIHFEITEEVLLRHTESLAALLQKIEGLGIQIELDDFGTGYTSLKHLADLPIHILKVDKSFVRHADTDPRKRALLKAIMEMARALDILVVTEGVERREEDEVIRELGAAVVQGYYYARPLSLEALIAVINTPERVTV